MAVSAKRRLRRGHLRLRCGESITMTWRQPTGALQSGRIGDCEFAPLVALRRLGVECPRELARHPKRHDPLGATKSFSLMFDRFVFEAPPPDRRRGRCLKGNLRPAGAHPPQDPGLKAHACT